METPICVTDAQTFIDHIHEIKRWIYNGQLRLIIPSSLSETVDQLYLKSIEPKSAPKEASKPKISGKPAKKEHPAFDANPRVAKVFLAGLQAGKEYQTGHLGRPIYEEEEKHGLVHFAQPREQYTPWKDVADVEEKPDVSENHQESWADKLRRKQNAANGNMEKKTAIGPIKPKLVAKTGVDTSPWKVQRNAPTIPATDVPASLRLTMSCALWRTHESIHRNDENQVFVLTNDTHITEVAQKLNITVRPSSELANLIAHFTTPSNIESFGELEQNFGVRPVQERKPIKNTANLHSRHTIMNGSAKLADSKAEAEPLTSATSDRNGISGIKSATPEPQMAAPEGHPLLSGALEQYNSDGAAGVGDHVREAGNNASTPTPPNGVAKDGLAKAGADPVFSACGNGVQHVESKPSEESQKPMPLGNEKTPETEKSKADFVDAPPPAINVWFRSLAKTLTGKQSAAPKDSRAKAKENPRLSIKSRTSDEAPNSPAESLPPPKAPSVQASEEIDSDEEVVVFQPKRLSAQQKKPVQQRSRPTTPNIQPQYASPTQSPRPMAAKGQHTPKVRHHQSRNVTGVAPGQPKLGNPKPPPVIDPDAFGRDFAVNTNSNPRGSLRSMRMRHSPHASLQHPGSDNSRPSSSHQRHRDNSDGSSPKVSPPQLSRTPVRFEETIQSTPNVQLPMESIKPTPIVQLPIGSGRPSPVPAAETRALMLNANAPVFRPASASPMQPSPVQPRSVPTPIAPPTQAVPAKLAPIGSGRPSSKSSLQLNGATPTRTPLPPAGVTSSNVNIRQEAPRAQQSLQTRDTDFVPQQNGPRPALRAKTQTPPPRATQTTNINGRHRGHQPGPQHRIAPRPTKPSLFEPELDHTRAFQSDAFETRKHVVPEVDYVLKSGSTREQARGKGTLWVG